MKTILCIGGEAHGRMVMDLGAKTMLLSAEKPLFTNIQQPDGSMKLFKAVDGYTRHRFDHQGWPSEVMLEDTLRPEDHAEWSAGLSIPTLTE